VELLRLLLDRGADPNNLSGTKTALMTAAYRGHRATFDLLIASGSDIFASYELAPDAWIDALVFARDAQHKELASHIEKEMKMRKRQAGH
jgi:ankyrin repeat protein